MRRLLPIVYLTFTLGGGYTSQTVEMSSMESCTKAAAVIIKTMSNKALCINSGTGEVWYAN